MAIEIMHIPTPFQSAASRCSADSPAPTALDSNTLMLYQVVHRATSGWFVEVLCKRFVDVASNTTLALVKMYPLQPVWNWTGDVQNIAAGTEHLHF